MTNPPDESTQSVSNEQSEFTKLLDALLYSDHDGNGYPSRREARTAILAQVTALEKQLAEARAATIEECVLLIESGNYVRHVGDYWLGLEKPSKNDKCVHDFYMYEDCEACAVAALRALAQPLQPQDEIKEEFGKPGVCSPYP